MIFYYPEVALRIVDRALSKGSSSYMKSINDFFRECSKEILNNPRNYVLYTPALLIFSDKKNVPSEPTPRVFKDWLHLWECSDMLVALKFLSRDYDDYSTLHRLALQYLNYASRDTMLFLLPALLQALRTYTDNKVEDFLVNISTKWPSLTHTIIWMAEVETELTEEGKKARKVPLERDDTLPETCKRVIERITGRLRKHQKDYFRTESDFFESITHISSILKPKMPKDEKRRIIKSKLEKINENIPKDIYLPTDPSCIVQSIVTTSGNPMQSAAKCPILVAFNVTKSNTTGAIPEEEQTNPEEEAKNPIPDKIGQFDHLEKPNSTISRITNTASDNIMNNHGKRSELDDRIFGSHKSYIRLSTIRFHNRRQTEIKKGKLPLQALTSPEVTQRAVTLYQSERQGSKSVAKTEFINKDVAIDAPQETRKVACIFKVFDDVRQDILALQICKLFKDIYKVFELDLYLSPYNVLCNRTGEERSIGGIIECVPNCKSRDEIGKDYDIDMYQYFIEMFGNPESETYLKAQQNFIKSLAGYAIFSYILQPKDRHNGNVMISNQGYLVHIDFGYIFDWSPGGDMRFESADFKFTNEMIKILGGKKECPAYKLFVSKTIQGYMAVRKYAQQICDLVYFAFHSGLPCFKPKSMRLLKKRFHSELSDCEAANVMRKIIDNAHNKWTTNGYDWIQKMQQNIAY